MNPVNDSPPWAGEQTNGQKLNEIYSNEPTYYLKIKLRLSLTG